MEVTDDKNLTKAERKRKQAESAASGSVKTKMLKVADKRSNLRAIAASPPADWFAKRTMEYVD